MKVTIDGITYEGTVEEIREIVRNPPVRSYGPTINYGPKITYGPDITNTTPIEWSEDFPRNWDGSPRVTCCII